MQKKYLHFLAWHFYGLPCSPATVMRRKGKSEISVGMAFIVLPSFLMRASIYNTHYSNSSGSAVVHLSLIIFRRMYNRYGIGVWEHQNWGSFRYVWHLKSCVFIWTHASSSQVRVKAGTALFVRYICIPGCQCRLRHADDQVLSHGCAGFAVRIRVGRQVAAFFAEVGFGYKGLHTWRPCAPCAKG